MPWDNINCEMKQQSYPGSRLCKIFGHPRQTTYMAQPHFDEEQTTGHQEMCIRDSKHTHAHRRESERERGNHKVLSYWSLDN